MTRFFSERERQYLATRPDPTGHAAARIAAKEAVYKAMQSTPGGTRGIGWREIEVSRDPEGGRPCLHGLAAPLSDKSAADSTIKISLTHSALSAGAIASRRSALGRPHTFNSDLSYSSLISVSNPKLDENDSHRRPPWSVHLVVPPN